MKSRIKEYDELKKELNIHVIAQILKRQTLTDEAYIAILKPTKKW